MKVNVYRVHGEYDRKDGRDAADRLQQVKASMMADLDLFAGPMFMRDAEIVWTWKPKPYSLTLIITAEARG